MFPGSHRKYTRRNHNIRLSSKYSMHYAIFNTQCDLCLAEIALIKEHLKKISKMYNIFLISFEPKRSLISFFTEKGIDINNKNIHIIADEDMILLDYYQIKGYPSFIILNTKYKMEYRGSAIDNSIISKLLKQNL